jgi:hypothetical protein
MKKILLLACVLLFISTSLYSQSDRMQNTPIRKLDDFGVLQKSIAPLNNSAVLPPFVLAPGFINGDVIIGPEIQTGLDGWGDYKTNGEANHYIQVDPTNPMLLHAIDVQSSETDPPGATSRRTKYAISSDGGATWSYVTDVPLIRSGFAVLQLADGTPNKIGAIANHNQPGSVVTTQLYVDAFAQLGSFTEYTQAGASIWPQMTVLSNDNIIIVSRPQSGSAAQNDTVFYSIWNGTSLGPQNVLWVATPPYSGGVAFSNMAFNVATNGNGTVGMIANPETETDVLDNPIVRMRISTDNGQTLGSAFDIFTPFLENGDQDTVAISGGHDLTFRQGTDDWYWVASGTADGLFAKTRLFLIRGTGNTVTSTTVIADTVNLPMMARTFFKPWAFQMSIDHPKFGWSADNSVLYVSYDVVTQDSGMNGFNTRDVFYQYSTDAGINWSEPVRITETPTIDEGFPSISLWNTGTDPSSYELNLVYMKDVGDGPTMFNGTSPTAPPSHNFQIYRKITMATTNISNNTISNPEEYALLQNYPNPFNPSTTITFNIPKRDYATLKVFNSAGIEVATLVNGNIQSGIHNISFDSKNLSSGVYFYTLSTSEFRETKKMVLLK